MSNGRQGALGGLAVVEMDSTAALQLIILVSLAGDQHDVALFGLFDCLLDRLCAVGDEGDVIRAGEAGADVAEYPFRVFQARVVVGDEDAV